MPRISVFLADDNLLVRSGVAALLQAEPDLEVVGVASDYESLVAGVLDCEPQVVVTDIRMPPTFQREGIEAAKEARGRFPGIGVVILSQFDDPEYAIALLADGAAGYGYLLKDRVADVGQFVDAVRRVAAGGTAMDAEVIAQLMSRHPADDPLATLSPRESEVLSLMAEGRSNAAIAGRLYVSEKAVGKHTSSIFTKLGLEQHTDDNRRVLAVLAYLNPNS